MMKKRICIVLMLAFPLGMSAQYHDLKEEFHKQVRDYIDDMRELDSLESIKLGHDTIHSKVWTVMLVDYKPDSGIISFSISYNMNSSDLKYRPEGYFYYKDFMVTTYSRLNDSTIWDSLRVNHITDEAIRDAKSRLLFNGDPVDLMKYGFWMYDGLYRVVKINDKFIDTRFYYSSEAFVPILYLHMSLDEAEDYKQFNDNMHIIDFSDSTDTE